MAPPLPAHVQRVAQILAQARLLDQAQMSAALRRVEQWGRRLAGEVVEMRYARESAVVEALAAATGMPRVDLRHVDVAPLALSRLDADTCKARGVFPFGIRDGALQIAVSDPVNTQSLTEVARQARCRINAFLCGETVLQKAISKYYHGVDVSLEDEPEGPIVSEMSELKLVDNFGKTLMINKQAAASAPGPIIAPLDVRSQNLPPPARASQPPPAARPSQPLQPLQSQPPPSAPPPAEGAALQAQLQRTLHQCDILSRSLAALLIEKKLFTAEELRARMAQAQAQPPRT